MCLYRIKDKRFLFYFIEKAKMAARGVEASTGGEISEESDERGSMWDLDQQLDQPMDEEAGRLRNMYKEKVPIFWFCSEIDCCFPALLF